MQQNPSQRLVRLQSQSVTTEDSPLYSLAALWTSSPPVLEEVSQPASPKLSSASSTSETPDMAEQPERQPLTVEQMLMNLQNSIIAMQQRAAQTDANITCLNELFDTRIPPPLEEENQPKPVVSSPPEPCAEVSYLQVEEGQIIDIDVPLARLQNGAFVLSASVSDLFHQPIPAVQLSSASSLDSSYFNATDPNPSLNLTDRLPFSAPPLEADMRAIS
ncbi:hypothetical protein RHMOL_Rhmol04G0251900 [Rhododendron molle]|uniref:Uncharacterized protein n=1 Tax=Rhododendron molle TaxID=49168 RepID=A0ACC0P5E0_RHOML|nr:hypothetical protein RHMOL_Rhmol04G0251900 [Rhododendron molle]